MTLRTHSGTGDPARADCDNLYVFRHYLGLALSLYKYSGRKEKISLMLLDVILLWNKQNMFYPNLSCALGCRGVS